MRRLLTGLRALVGRRQLDRDLDDELRGYFDSLVEQHLREGMPPEDALKAARTTIGSLEAIKDAVQPLSQFTVPVPIVDFGLSVRAGSGSPALLARNVASALTSFDSNLAFSLHPLADQVTAARQQERLVAWLSGFVGVLALLLAGLGLHGVTAYTSSGNESRSVFAWRLALSVTTLWHLPFARRS